jgi:hypothetical protein
VCFGVEAYHTGCTECQDGIQLQETDAGLGIGKCPRTICQPYLYICSI